MVISLHQNRLCEYLRQINNVVGCNKKIKKFLHSIRHFSIICLIINDSHAVVGVRLQEQRRGVLIEVAALLQKKVEVFEQAEAMDKGQTVDYKVAIVEEVLKISQFTLNNTHNNVMNEEG